MDNKQKIDAQKNGANALNALFEEKSLKERARLTLVGLGMSRDSGAYKFARLQVQLLLGLLLAMCAPLLILIALFLMPAKAPDDASLSAVTIFEPEPAADLVMDEPPYEPPDFELTLDAFNDIATDAPAIDAQSEVPAPPNIILSPKPAAVNAVSQIKSPITMRGILGSTRDTGARGQALQAYGGGRGAQTEAAVMRALRWLKSKQEPDGSWAGNFVGANVSAKSRLNATGFALLAFLAHGELPGISEEFGETVERGLKYLAAQKDPDYIGIYALIEAYVMTKNPVLYTPIVNGLRQWAPKLAKGDGDVLVGAFMAMALYAAKTGDIDFDQLDQMLLNVENNYREKGQNALRSSGGSSTWHMTFYAVGLQYLGKHDDPVVKGTVDKLMSFWPGPTLEKMHLACCPARANYFVTMMYFNMGGGVWNKWNNDMASTYLKGQVIESGKYVDHKGQPHDIGYWRYDDSAGGAEHAGTQPLISTCYVAQQLMVYYRYSPTNRKAIADRKALEAPPTRDFDDIQIKIIL